jgi:pyrroloquinoline quinone biosynthesis protein D
VSQLSADSRPKLRPGCRLSQSPQQGDVLLIPEGVLRLVGPGKKIVERCDGQRTVEDIIRELKAEYPSVEPERIATEVTTFIERLLQKRVLDTP